MTDNLLDCLSIGHLVEIAEITNSPRSDDLYIYATSASSNVPMNARTVVIHPQGITKIASTAVFVCLMDTMAVGILTIVLDEVLSSRYLWNYERTYAVRK